MNNLVKSLSITLFVLLTSCVAIKPYIEPSSGSSAKIQFKTVSGGMNLKVQYAPDSLNGCNCATPPVQLIGILHNKALGMGKYADKGEDVDSFTITAVAGKSFRFVIDLPNYQTNSVTPVMSTTASFCQAHQEFTPEQGKVYQVLYDVNVEKCALSIYEIDNEDKKPVSFRSLPPCVVYPEFNGWVEKGIRDYCNTNQDLYTISSY